jgi:hypothetical protein
VPPTHSSGAASAARGLQPGDRNGLAERSAVRVEPLGQHADRDDVELPPAGVAVHALADRWALAGATREEDTSSLCWTLDQLRRMAAIHGDRVLLATPASISSCSSHATGGVDGGRRRRLA